MAFQDIDVLLYDESIKLEYKDKAHRYYAYPRIDFERAIDDKKAWGKNLAPKGTTTLLDETLEKKGLLTWPMGMALQELFGFYDFTNERSERMTGFSADKGTLWGLLLDNKEDALPLILSASKNWTRRQKKGADIGSVVHNAIEHFLKDEYYDIDAEYTSAINTSEYDSERLRLDAIEQLPQDLASAHLAFERFVTWWNYEKPELIGAEQIVYSKEYNISGTFDGLIRLNGKLVLCDWKTSNASVSAGAPEGVYYSYFIQSAIYSIAYEEMHTLNGEQSDGNSYVGYLPPEYKVDDIAIISCRKDGGFSALFASDIGVDMDVLKEYAKSVIYCNGAMKRIKAGLIDHAKGEK